ncbi:MAG: hypothetical protein AAGA71_00475 [Pseudomonadota bacterium]
MTKSEDDQTSDRLEEAIVLLTKLNAPKPKSFWDKLPVAPLRDAVPLIDQIAREGNKFLMQEKMLQVRLLNEGWLGEPCDALMPMADALAELRAFNAAAGSAEDAYLSEMTVAATRAQCQ